MGHLGVTVARVVTMSTPDLTPGEPLPAEPDVRPPPAPEGAASWPEFTARLRVLYEWCGTPEYRALCGRATGLSPAAIPTLIGPNPLTRPSRSATERFVEACLRHREWPDPGGAERDRWVEHWTRLDQGVAASPPTATTADAVTASDAVTAAGTGAGDGGGGEEEEDEDEGRSGRHARRYAVIGAAAVAAALAAGVVAFVTAPAAKRPAPTPGCQYMRGTIKDTRANRTYTHLYQCPNRVHTDVYEQAGFGTRVGVLDTDPSRFVCWTRGERHPGGNDVWYYTQGDRAAQRPDLDAWGYVPASELHTGEHPDPAVTRRCPGEAKRSGHERGGRRSGT